jgi:hypothetical protein
MEERGFERRNSRQAWNIHYQSAIDYQERWEIIGNRFRKSRSLVARLAGFKISDR